MEGVKGIIKKRSPIKNKNIHSEMHYWADVISSTFREQRRFAMYLGIIKRIGIKEAKRIFAEVRHSDSRSPGRLFVWKASRKNLSPPTNRK